MATKDFSNTRLVPNRQPSIKGLPYRIAIIGEAPGVDEEHTLQPFVGASGRFLNALLSKASIMREACMVGNVCQQRPPDNDISHFSPNGPEFTHGLAELSKDLQQFEPNLCILLGKTALLAAKGTDKITSWRGSFFIGDIPGPFYGRKCISSYHPAFCLRMYSWTPILLFDLIKAKTEAFSPELVLPHRDISINLSVNEILHRIDDIRNNRLTIACDIEGALGTFSCCGIATSATSAFVIPFANMDNGSYWQNPEDELRIWRAFSNLMADPLVPKIWQNGLYDRFILQYGYSVIVLNNKEDTLLKFWEQWCELDKDLGFQCSILGKEPYYKYERKSDDRDTFFRYCGKDACVTFENNTALDRLLTNESRRHYEFNIALLNPLLYIELRGIRYDMDKAAKRLKELEPFIYQYQYNLDLCAHLGLDYSKPRNELQQQARELMGWKKDITKPKKEFEQDYDRVIRILLGEGQLEPWEKGYLNTALGLGMNVRSPKFKTFLYSDLNLPPKYKIDHKAKTKRLTTDYEALLRLSKETAHPAVSASLEITRLRTRAQLLEIHVGPDGRLHWTTNLVGSETGRITTQKSLIKFEGKRTGTNTQAIPDDWDMEDPDHPLAQGARDLCLADEGCYIAQQDLKGSDGWTIGAHLAALGDDTMLEDLRFGLKPANVVCYLFRHGASSLDGKSRAEIKELCSTIKKTDWDYLMSKQGIWGTCYTMGAKKLMDRLFIESDGKINKTTKEGEVFQAAIKSRYKIKLLHAYCERQIQKSKYLISPSGHRRRFFSRDTEVLGEWLAHEPQSNTTYASNLTLYNLWSDVENRVRMEDDKIKLRVEPLHQVHDANINQFKISDTAWAITKIKQWSNNPVKIAGQDIIIPFEGAYGISWGDLSVGVI